MEQQQLIDRLEADLRLRNRAPKTRVTYLQNVRRYLNFINRPLEDTDEEDIRAFIESLIEIELQPASTNHYLSAILFFYEITLNIINNPQATPVE